MQRVFGLIIVTLACAFMPAAQARPLGDWKVVQGTGDVVILVDGVQKVAIDPNAALPEGTIIATGKNGRAVVRRGDEQIVVQPQTRLKLTNGSPTATRFLQSTGSALYHIGKKRTPHFQVDTPYLAAIVKGTVFTVSVDGSHADVAVTEGAVEVSTNAGAAVTLVKPGMTARVGQADQRQIDLQDRAGSHRLITANEGGWSSGGGSSTGGGPGASSSGGSGGAALLRTGSDQGPSAHHTNLTGLRDSTIAIEVTSASDHEALRLSSAPETGSETTGSVAIIESAPALPGLRQTVSDIQGPGSQGNKLHGMASTVDDAASALAGKVGATMHSLARHKPLKVSATMPWTELSLGVMGLITLMIMSHIRSLRARTKKLEALT